ncbi:tetratricopeptide repeat protein [Streptomyces sp. NPDC059816]|uniref:tetratricopeptide repeat protein n=1 Tax=Streptomyces sp. NPDC059816 TaxID=3346960 RepID=UPI0036668EE5
MADPAQELNEQLRALEQRAQAARKAAGQPSSRREAAAATARTKYGVAVRFQAISAWLAVPPKQATVPSAASSEHVLALVQVWSQWAGETPKERYWRNLLDRAQAPAGRTAPGADCEISNVPVAAGFVGRTAVLNALDSAFASPGGVVLHAVHGLGGVGKSALAAHWAARRASARVRWWITADGSEAVDAGLAALARALRPALGELPATLQVEHAVQWLATHDDWLLVLDNVDRVDDVRVVVDRLPGRGRVLVTTRRATGWHRYAATVHLDVFEPAESVALFTGVLAHHDRDDADGVAELCAELGHLALAVEQAAAYCAETGTSPRAYLGMLAQWPGAMFAAAAEGGDAERTVARIWRLTLDRLTGTPLARRLLRILAWYAPTGIPRDLLDGCAEPPPELATALGRLVAYSMVTDHRDGTLSVHRLVQALARTPDPDDPHRDADDIADARDQAAALLSGAFPTAVEHPPNWPRCRALLPHVDALSGHHSPELDTVHTARALDRGASYRKGQGVFAPALPALERALGSRERLMGTEHIDTLVSRNNLATTYDSAGHPGRAVSVHERCAEDHERVLGVDHPNTLISRSNLAEALREVGDVERALSLHEGVLRDRERVLGADHPDTLLSRNNLAGVYRAVGDVRRSLALLERTLKDYERVLGVDHPNTLISRNNLAEVHRLAGDAERALSLHEGVLRDRERVLGADHPNTLLSRNNLASVHQQVGDLGRALALYERTLKDCERILGTDHPLTLLVWQNLEQARAQ